MAQTFAIDENGDTYLDASGNIAMLYGADAVGQDCVTAMRAQRGEMQYAMDRGMPTAATAFDKFNPYAFESFARDTIEAVAAVVRVTEFTVSVTNNVLSYTATIETIYGTTYIQGNV